MVGEELSRQVECYGRPISEEIIKYQQTHNLVAEFETPLSNFLLK